MIEVHNATSCCVYCKRIFFELDLIDQTCGECQEAIDLGLFARSSIDGWSFQLPADFDLSKLDFSSELDWDDSDIYSNFIDIARLFE